MTKNLLGIYIHVPFCKSKCPYCDFYSVTPHGVDEYMRTICSEIGKWRGNIGPRNVDTIYFGGGTPSLLGCDKILEILDCIFKKFGVFAPEVTVEVNPADYQLMDFKKLKRGGVNRISVGAQSLSDGELVALGRRHCVNDIILTCEAIKRAGIENISADIILGTSGQTLESINKFVDFCSAGGIKHVSAYLLKIEEGTPFYKIKDILGLPSDDFAVELYLHAVSRLKDYGYAQYEISNFARIGFESCHNLKYWDLSQYLGIGPAAHSLINGQRFYYPASLDKFIKTPYVLPEGEFEPEKEYPMLRLRLCEGLQENLYERRFKKNIPRDYFERAKKYEEAGLLNLSEHSIRLNERGFLLSNTIIADILN